MTWVAKVANAFIKGYNDGHPNQPAYISVATTNDDDGWTETSTNWYNSGHVWGQMIKDLVAGSRVTVWSGNDAEGFDEDLCQPQSSCPWQSFGSSTWTWINGYVAGSAHTRWNMDWGTNPPAEDPHLATTWNTQQTFEVAYGASDLEWPIPQIYCNSYLYISSWYTPVAYSGNAMYFYGVTAEDHYSRVCNGGYSLYWQDAWNDFHNKISTPVPNGVFNNAIGYTVPTPHR